MRRALLFCDGLVTRGLEMTEGEIYGRKIWVRPVVGSTVMLAQSGGK
jgi:hypothetical protein